MISPYSIPQLKQLADGFYAEYVVAYAKLRVNGASVLDIGADFGTSVDHFLRRGASRVIAYESNPEWNQILRQLTKGDSRVEVHDAWNGERPEVDIIKVDIEGGEVMLTPAHFASYRQWAIALHPTMLLDVQYHRLMGLVKEFGGELVYQTGDGKEKMYCRVGERNKTT